MFIVKKRVGEKEYYYLRKSVREGGKVKAISVAYLGRNKMEAESKMKEIVSKVNNSSNGENGKNMGKSMGKFKNTRKEVISMDNNSKENMKKENMEKVKMDLGVEELATFCKRKGFVYPSGEIYGGLAGFYDYGHLGFLLKRNFENAWKDFFLGLNDNFYQIEASEIMPEQTFVASGHLKNFSDVASKCKKGHIERADHLLEKNLNKKFEGLNADEMFDLIKKNKIVCSVCNGAIEYVGAINMMFPLQLGVGNQTKAYLRPETAQSPYVNFKIQYELTRSKLPLGLALIGRAYRNELSPRNLLLRQRAFTQAELQIFFNPSKINEHESFDEIKNYNLAVISSNDREKGIQKIKAGDLAKNVPKFYVYHMAKVQQFYFEVLKIDENKFRFYELNDKEKAFYNKYHFDMELDIPGYGWTEVGGVHYRTDHDLKGHQEISKQKMEVYDEQTKERFIPHVLELSFGVDRNFQALLAFAFNFDKNRENVVLKLPAFIAPIKATILPIIKDDRIIKICREIQKDLKSEWNVSYDESGSIGRRYARNDEIGTPLCITIDEDSLKDDGVTIRDRDTSLQVRVKMKQLKDILKRVIDGEDVLKMGKVVETRKK